MLESSTSGLNCGSNVILERSGRDPVRRQTRPSFVRVEVRRKAAPVPDDNPRKLGKANPPANCSPAMAAVRHLHRERHRDTLIFSSEPGSQSSQFDCLFSTAIVRRPRWNGIGKKIM